MESTEVSHKSRPLHQENLLEPATTIMSDKTIKHSYAKWNNYFLKKSAIDRPTGEAVIWYSDVFSNNYPKPE